MPNYFQNGCIFPKQSCFSYCWNYYNFIFCIILRTNLIYLITNIEHLSMFIGHQNIFWTLSVVIIFAFCYCYSFIDFLEVLYVFWLVNLCKLNILHISPLFFFVAIFSVALLSFFIKKVNKFYAFKWIHFFFIYTLNASFLISDQIGNIFIYC